MSDDKNIPEDNDVLTAKKNAESAIADARTAKLNAESAVTSAGIAKTNADESIPLHQVLELPPPLNPII